MFFQGRFRIDLSGTGIKVAEATSWVSQGNYAAADIQKSQVRTVSPRHSSDKPLKMVCLFVFLEKNNTQNIKKNGLTSCVRRGAAECQEGVEATVVNVHHLLTPTCQ